MYILIDYSVYLLGPVLILNHYCAYMVYAFLCSNGR